MLTIFKDELQTKAKSNGYRPEILEKVLRLLDLLEQINSVAYLQERLALKGGTAINLFCSDHIPRLSVDLDFNYIGSSDLGTMQRDRLKIETIIIDICHRLKYTIHRNARAHAGGKAVLIYQSILGNKGRLEIDFNYIFRIPLWNVNIKSAAAWLNTTQTPILDQHELAAGKLHALLGRTESRDLFDSHQLLTHWSFDASQLRSAFTAYAAMEKQPWQTITLDKVNFTTKDIRNRLIPVLKQTEIPGTSSKLIELWATQLVDECKQKLAAVLPFKDHEIEFLDRLQQFGEIQPELISKDDDFCERILKHPSIIWRAKQKMNGN